MNKNQNRKFETEEPQYVDEVFPEDEAVDPWSEDADREETPASDLEPEEEVAAKEDAPPAQTSFRLPAAGSTRSRAASSPTQRPSAFDRQRQAERRTAAPSVDRTRLHARKRQPPTDSPSKPDSGPTNPPAALQAQPAAEPASEPGHLPVIPPAAAGKTRTNVPALNPAPPARAVVVPEAAPLDDLIAKHQPLPPGSLILGADEAGKALVFSLEDPSLGALLFMGDNAAATRRHLAAVVASAAILSEPDLLQIDVITPDPEAFTSKRSNLRQVCTPDDDCIFGVLGDILSAMEIRLRDRRMLPFQILVLDEVDRLTAQLAEDSLRFLRWIMRRGPEVGVWPIASIPSDRLESFDRKTFRAFGFHLYGKMEAAGAVARYTRVPAYYLNRLAEGAQGCLKLEKDVISFRIPVAT